MLKGKLFVGTSGWSYPHWGRGVFYPKSVPTQKWLEYYAEKFNAVEVNSTFYRLPAPALLRRWVEITPPEFCFVIKVWRRLSHELRLKAPEEPLNEFNQAIEPIKQKTSVYLLQMPPSYIPDVDQINAFFDVWFSVFPNSRLALELRNKKAFNDDVFSLLKERGVCLVLEDYKGCEIDDVNTANWVYIRRHGPSGRYRGKYDQAQLRKDAKKIKNWLRKGMDVYVFFNNDFGGYAPENAMQLTSLIKIEEKLPEKKEPSRKGRSKNKDNKEG